MSVTTLPSRRVVQRQPGWLVRLFDYKPFLIVICLTPAIGLLAVFLTYPLGLGIWLAFTDTTIGRRGVFVGLENFQYLLTDPLWWNAVFYSVFYTAVATFGKFALGFWLALLLNNHFPFKSLLRAIVLLPWIVPTVLSALAFWWIYDPQFSIISYLLVDVLHVRSTNIDFLGSPWPARFSLIAANIWRGIPFVAISLLAGLQTISPALYEAAMLDGATAWQRFRYITFPMMLPILAIVMTFSIIFTFTDFQLVYAITRGGPVNSTHLLATLAFQRGIAGGELGEGAAIAVSMIPFLVFATLFSYFGLARRKWQQGESNDGHRCTIQRRQRHAGYDGVGFPRAAGDDDLSAAVLLRADPAVSVLLDGDHLVQAERGTAQTQGTQPVLDHLADHRPHPASVVQHRLSALAEDHDVRRGRIDDPVIVRFHARGLRDRAAALPRQPLCRPRDLSGLSGAAVDPVHSPCHRRGAVRPVRQPAGADPGVPDLPGAVLPLALDRLFQLDPV